MRQVFFGQVSTYGRYSARYVELQFSNDYIQTMHARAKRYYLLLLLCFDLRQDCPAESITMESVAKIKATEARCPSGKSIEYNSWLVHLNAWIATCTWLMG